MIPRHLNHPFLSIGLQLLTGGHAQVCPSGIVCVVERAPRLQADAGVLQLGHAHIHARGAGGLPIGQMPRVRLCKAGERGALLTQQTRKWAAGEALFPWQPKRGIQRVVCL